MERTFVMLKPDAVQRGLVGEIVQRFERRGLKIVAMKLLQMSTEFAHKHYEVHVGKPFFEGLIKYITSGPVVALVLEGANAIEVARATMGATHPAKAAPGTIRADFSLEMGRNLVHGSDGSDTAAFEIGLWFGEQELVDYGRSVDPWIFE
ncbi:MAG: nucleoside-diphosphate kinase [Chloroflexi bacterium HGW-Chloroflexi-1]|nr:MAG: nucleoside-diphosphate kinase [Chloroflexi bacterium HGW-Chloroflexi-1]